MTKSFDNRDGWIWMNGEFIEWKKAKSHIFLKECTMPAPFLRVREHTTVKFLNLLSTLKDFSSLLKLLELQFHIQKNKSTKQKMNL